MPLAVCRDLSTLDVERGCNRASGMLATPFVDEDHPIFGMLLTVPWSLAALHVEGRHPRARDV